MTDAAVPYEEPGIVTILIQSSFFLLSNVLTSILDHVLYCGLVGQVLLGMVWGTPGAKLLSKSFKDIATQIGYLGLILIVFEGGLSTSVSSVQKTLLLSIGVAVTGILLPIAFSFSLLKLASSTNLEAFAAGAALCSTSLGTTFSLLKSTGLTTSRLGTVLTTAAMLDDVVGLVMVQVIGNLGSGDRPFHASTILRPILVSAGLAVAVPLFCGFVLRPIILHTGLGRMRLSHSLMKMVNESMLHFLFSTTFLVGLVAAASYAGASVLFAAYLAGTAISWVDGMAATSPGANRFPKQNANIKPSSAVDEPAGLASTCIDDKPDIQSGPGTIVGNANDGLNDGPASSPRLLTPPPENVTDLGDHGSKTVSKEVAHPSEPERGGMRMYRQYYGAAVERILKPLFFASIGFSIPISKMFRGAIVWRGIIYAIFMCIGKLCCGLWLVRFSVVSVGSAQTAESSTKTKSRKKNSGRKAWARPKSLYPAAILGCAMVARGEIGFLISAIADTNGIFSADISGQGKDYENHEASSPSDVYLIVTWAILLCTILGPLTLGSLAKRVKRLQSKRSKDREGSGEDPLGIWGVS